MSDEAQREQWRKAWEESLEADRRLADYMRRRKEYGGSDRDGEQQKGRGR